MTAPSVTTPMTAGRSGGPAAELPRPTVFACDLRELCRERGWSHGRLRREMRRAAAARQLALPADDCLKVMVSRWVNGKRGVSEFYAALLSEVLGCRMLPGKPGSVAVRDAASLARHVERLTAELAALSSHLGQAADLQHREDRVSEVTR